MHRFIVFETLFRQFRRALAAAHRYDRLKYAPHVPSRSAPATIPGQIFEEFYGPQSNAEPVAHAPDRPRRFHPRFGL